MAIVEKLTDEQDAKCVLLDIAISISAWASHGYCVIKIEGNDCRWLGHNECAFAVKFYTVEEAIEAACCVEPPYKWQGTFILRSLGNTIIGPKVFKELHSRLVARR